MRPMAAVSRARPSLSRTRPPRARWASRPGCGDLRSGRGAPPGPGWWPRRPRLGARGPAGGLRGRRPGGPRPGCGGFDGPGCGLVARRVGCAARGASGTGVVAARSLVSRGRWPFSVRVWWPRGPRGRAARPGVRWLPGPHAVGLPVRAWARPDPRCGHPRLGPGGPPSWHGAVAGSRCCGLLGLRCGGLLRTRCGASRSGDGRFRCGGLPGSGTGAPRPGDGVAVQSVLRSGVRWRRGPGVVGCLARGEVGRPVPGRRLGIRVRWPRGAGAARLRAGRGGLRPGSWSASGCLLWPRPVRVGVAPRVPGAVALWVRCGGPSGGAPGVPSCGVRAAAGWVSTKVAG